MRYSRQSYTYLFYYRLTPYGDEIEVLIRDCKQPKRTKVYKDLMQSLNTSEVHSVGYRVINN